MRPKYEGFGGCIIAAIACPVLERRGGKASRHLLDVQPVDLDSLLASHLISYQLERSQHFVSKTRE
jgi:hypothetical protein